MQKRLIILIMLVLIVLLLASSSISIWAINNYINLRKLFINDVYNSIKIIEKELGEFDEDNTDMVDRVAVGLALLDKLCDTQRKYTNGAFYYENRGRFIAISDRLSTGEYDENKIELLQKIFNDALNKLSDASGQRENEHLSYKEISNILVDLFDKVDDLQ